MWIDDEKLRAVIRAAFQQQASDRVLAVLEDGTDEEIAEALDAIEVEPMTDIEAETLAAMAIKSDDFLPRTTPKLPSALSQTREHLIREILDRANALERDGPYPLQCGLWCDVGVSVGKLCRSETDLNTIAAAFEQAFSDVEFDVIVSAGSPRAMAYIARRVASRREMRVEEIICEEIGDTLNFEHEIRRGARVLILVDVNATGALLANVETRVKSHGGLVVGAGAIAELVAPELEQSRELRALCQIRVTMTATELCHCNLTFNPLIGRWTKKGTARSLTEFLQRDPQARRLWWMLDHTEAFRLYEHLQGRVLCDFVDFPMILGDAIAGPQIVNGLCNEILARFVDLDLILVNPRSELAAMVARQLRQDHGISVGVVEAKANGNQCGLRNQPWGLADSDLGLFQGKSVLVCDTFVAHGTTLDNLTRLATAAGATRVGAAVILSRLPSICEASFQLRLTGNFFFSLFHLPIEPLSLVTLPPRAQVSNVNASRASSCDDNDIVTFLKNCRPAIASGVTRHALFAQSNDGMAPLTLPELANEDIPASVRAAMVADLPRGTIEWSGKSFRSELEQAARSENELLRLVARQALCA